MLFWCVYFFASAQPAAYIRINQLGYPHHGVKVAVLGSKNTEVFKRFVLVDATTKQAVFKGIVGHSFGKYDPFTNTYQIDFSSYSKKGKYFLQAGIITSPTFTIDDSVYNGAADFCLRYMRQQRNGFNPFLKDSCHTHDGYTLYAPIPDSTHIDVVGGTMQAITCNTPPLLPMLHTI